MSLYISTYRRCLIFAALLIALSFSTGSLAAHAATSSASVVAKAAPMNSDPAAESQIVTLVNQARAKKHLKPLIVNATLTMIARNHSNDMMLYNYVSHYGKNDGKSPFQRMHDAGYNYTWAGENIAAGYPTPEAAMNGWMHSAEHKRNILNKHFTEIGVGLAYGGGSYGYYWTEDFGSR